MTTDLSAIADPDPGWLSYRVFFTSTARPFAPLDVRRVRQVSSREVLLAVLEHVAPRWPGAVLDVRINETRMTGRVLAGGRPGRRVAAFALLPYAADGTPPAAPPVDPRALLDHVDEGQGDVDVPAQVSR